MSSFEEQIKNQFAEATGKKFEDMVKIEVDKYKSKVKESWNKVKGLLNDYAVEQFEKELGLEDK